MFASVLDFLHKFHASFASTEFMEKTVGLFQKLTVFPHSFIIDQENGICRNILQMNMCVESDIKKCVYSI